MPIFKSISTFEIARGIKAFLNLEAGLTRGKIPEPGDSERLRIQTQKLKRTQRQLEQTRRQLENKDNRIARLKKQSKVSENGGVNPENIIWILGTGRSGSTWLASMMQDLGSHLRWEEPRVGEVFGDYMHRHGQRTAVKTHILSSHYKKTWLNSLRSVILDGAAERFPEMGREEYLVIKEPNGSSGAPLLLEALPESRMVFLVRDPRDVCASLLDGARKGSWLYMTAEEGDWSRDEDGPLSPADTNPNAVVEERANHYLQDIRSCKQAYEAHEGYKVMVKYEDLRADPLGTMRHIYSSLGIAIDREELTRSVNKHSWNNIPEERKGRGKFYRKANPGSWEEDLTPEQVQIVERITAPLLEEFYPDE